MCYLCVVYNNVGLLSTETANREAAVSTEASTRLAADQSLASDLSTETLNRENAVSAEASTRLAADNSLETKISADLSTANASVENEWDKGHMAPAADFCYSRDAMWATFSYTNCALQHYKLNRGVWKQLETAERDWAKKDSIIVHIDVLFDPNSKPLPSGATIPKSFRKTITFYSTGKKLVYEFPNIPPTQPLDKYLIKGKLFGQAVVIRKVSKFMIGSDEDMLMPIPVFYDLETKKILPDSLPKEIRDEYKDITLD